MLLHESDVVTVEAAEVEELEEVEELTFTEVEVELEEVLLSGGGMEDKDDEEDVEELDTVWAEVEEEEEEVDVDGLLVNTKKAAAPPTASIIMTISAIIAGATPRFRLLMKNKF